MAYMDADAILTAVRDVLEDAAGSLRTIAGTRFDGGMYDGLPEEEQSRRAMDKAITEAAIVSVEDHETNFSLISNRRIRRIEVEVTVIRHTDYAEKLSDAARDDVKALATSDADVIAQALMYPGNLTQDSAANATGLVSGMLSEFLGSEATYSFAEGEPGRIDTRHTFAGLVVVQPATS